MRRSQAILYLDNMRRGQKARLRCALPAGINYSILAVYARAPGSVFSPYVPHDIADMTAPGLPVMAMPLYFELKKTRREVEFTICAAELTDFAFMQEVESAADKKLILEVKTADGTIIQKAGRFLRNKLRLFCRDYARPRNR